MGTSLWSGFFSRKGGGVDAKDANDWTALHVAARYGHGAVTRVLLDEGVAIDAKAAHDWTALHMAADIGHEAVVEVLLEKGAAVDEKDTEGWTALNFAKMRSQRSSS